MVFQEEASGSYSSSVNTALSHTVEQEGNSFSSFSLDTSRHRCTFLTSTGDLLTSFEYSFTAAGSLVSCRSKSHTNGKLQNCSATPAQLYSKSLGRPQHGETQGQQRAHGPCSHPLWKRGLSLQSIRTENDSVIRGPTDYCVWL